MFLKIFNFRNVWLWAWAEVKTREKMRREKEEFCDSGRGLSQALATLRSDGNSAGNCRNPSALRRAGPVGMMGQDRRSVRENRKCNWRSGVESDPRLEKQSQQTQRCTWGASSLTTSHHSEKLFIHNWSTCLSIWNLSQEENEMLKWPQSSKVVRVTTNRTKTHDSRKKTNGWKFCGFLFMNWEKYKSSKSYGKQGRNMFLCKHKVECITAQIFPWFSVGIVENHILHIW